MLVWNSEAEEAQSLLQWCPGYHYSDDWSYQIVDESISGHAQGHTVKVTLSLLCSLSSLITLVFIVSAPAAQNMRVRQACY